MQSLSITMACYAAAIRGQMQYRTNFVMMVVLGLMYQGSGIAFLWVVLGRFGTIAGWTFGEIALLYAMRLLAHAVWVVPFHQLEFLDGAVQEGRFDRFLVRPLNPFLQVITARFQLNVIGDVAAAVVLLIVAVNLVDVPTDPLHLAYFVLAIIGGALAEGAAVVVVSSLSFRFVRVWSAYHLADSVFLLFGSYPTRIFGPVLNWILTWIVPVALVAYIPSSVLLGKTDELRLPVAVAALAPLIGAAFFFAAYRFWRWQIRSYQSVGN